MSNRNKNKSKSLKTETKTKTVSLATTAVLGITGIVMENDAIQFITCLLPIIEKIILGIYNPKLPFDSQDKELKSELQIVIVNTIHQFDTELGNKSQNLYTFFRAASSRIEAEYQHGFSVSEMTSWLQDVLKLENKLEAKQLTEKEIKDLIDTFIKIFSVQASIYPQVAQYFNFCTLQDHEHRLGKLESVSMKLNTLNYPPFFHNDTQEYADKFMEPLFLHKILPDENQISLKDIFVIPSATRLDKYFNSSRQSNYENIAQALAEFIQNKYIYGKDYYKRCNILFIEGLAAMGKSSLVSWLAWNYINHTENAQKIFQGKKLIVIRLRDLLLYGNRLNITNPLEDILSYLFQQNCATTENRLDRKKILKDTVLVLDGFDELCMVEAIIDKGKNLYFQSLSNTLATLNCNCKVIITTRPNYINISSLDFIKGYILIESFNSEKRKQFIENYAKREPLQEKIKNVFLTKQTHELECLMETPLVLYMIAAKKLLQVKLLISGKYIISYF